MTRQRTSPCLQKIKDQIWLNLFDYVGHRNDLQMWLSPIALFFASVAVLSPRPLSAASFMYFFMSLFNL